MKAAEFREQLLTSFLVLQVYLEESLAPVCKEQGITMQQFHILMELDRHGHKKAGDLSDMVGIQRGNMAGICKKMEQNGWLKRQRKADDERVVLISLTEEGKQVKKEIEEKIEERLDSAFESEPAENMEMILKGIDSLGQLMEKMNK